MLPSRIADLKQRVDLLALVGRDTPLRRTAATGGGEYHGPCPFCGGKDRFILQLQAPPGKLPQGQRWKCRQCSERWGDVLSYLSRRANLSFAEALRLLETDGLARLPPLSPVSPAPPGPTGKPPPSGPPQTDLDLWRAAAGQFSAQAAKNLWEPPGAEALDYLHGRGLQDETLRLLQIGYHPQDTHDPPGRWGLPEGRKVWIPKGIVIPCACLGEMHSIKIRRGGPGAKYLMLPGSRMWPYGLQTMRGKLNGFFFESELDVLLAWQTGLGVGFAALPAGQDWLRPEYAPFFESPDEVDFDIFVAFDNDPPGERAAARLLGLPHFHPAKPLPEGKDLTEFHQSGGSVLDWLLESLEL